MVSHYDTEMTRLSMILSIREKLYARNPTIFIIFVKSFIVNYIWNSASEGISWETKEIIVWICPRNIMKQFISYASNCSPVCDDLSLAAHVHEDCKIESI